MNEIEQVDKLIKKHTVKIQEICTPNEIDILRANTFWIEKCYCSKVGNTIEASFLCQEM